MRITGIRESRKRRLRYAMLPTPRYTIARMRWRCKQRGHVSNAAECRESFARGKDGVMNSRLSSVSAKRDVGRRSPDPPCNLSPAPHMIVLLREQTFETLLDIGSETLFVNHDTTEILQELGEPLITEKGEITLANGNTISGRGDRNCLRYSDVFQMIPILNNP